MNRSSIALLLLVFVIISQSFAKVNPEQSESEEDKKLQFRQIKSFAEVLNGNNNKFTDHPTAGLKSPNIENIKEDFSRIPEEDDLEILENKKIAEVEEAERLEEFRIQQEKEKEKCKEKEKQPEDKPLNPQPEPPQAIETKPETKKEPIDSTPPLVINQPAQPMSRGSSAKNNDSGFISPPRSSPLVPETSQPGDVPKGYSGRMVSYDSTTNAGISPSNTPSLTSTPASPPSNLQKNSGGYIKQSLSLCLLVIAIFVLI